MSERDINHQEQERKIRDGVDGPIHQQELDKINASTTEPWRDLAAQSHPEVVNRCAFEYENYSGCDFKGDDEGTACADDAPEVRDREDPVLEQDACWHEMMLSQRLA